MSVERFDALNDCGPVKCNERNWHVEMASMQRIAGLHFLKARHNFNFFDTKNAHRGPKQQFIILGTLCAFVSEAFRLVLLVCRAPQARAAAASKQAECSRYDTHE